MCSVIVSERQIARHGTLKGRYLQFVAELTKGLILNDMRYISHQIIFINSIAARGTDIYGGIEAARRPGIGTARSHVYFNIYCLRFND